MQQKPKIVYPDADADDQDVYRLHFDRLMQYCDLEIHQGRPVTDEEYRHRIKHADGVLLGWDMPSRVMRAATRLKTISFTGVGADKFVDLAEARNQGILVSNCPGYSDNTVAEHTMALLLGLARNVPKLDTSTRTGQWTAPFQHSGFEGMELRGKKIGLIGFGGIGRRFAKLCCAFDMQVLVWTRTVTPEKRKDDAVEFVELDQLYRESDIVSIHLASTPDTHQFIGEQAFKQMKTGAFFLNTARGELVDEAALVAALGNGSLGAAALDVFTGEPLAAENPIAQLDNVILTPHIGYRTPDATQTLFSMAIDNLISFFQGKPTNVINANEG